MTPAIQTHWTTVYHGHVLDVLTALPAASVHAVVTSPPFWALRDYQVPPVLWEDGQVCCLGLEADPGAYIRHLMQVMAALWRVLRQDGVAFINLGDTFSGGGGYFPDAPSNRNGSKQSTNHGSIAGRTRTGIPPKSLCLIPERFVIAAQEQGWIVRQKVPHIKRSCMPSSQQDRPTSALEWWFMLVKHPHYFSDMEAVRQLGVVWRQSNHDQAKNTQDCFVMASNGQPKHRGLSQTQPSASGRTFRNTDLWFQSLEAPFGVVGVGDELVGLDIVSQGTAVAHYATFGRNLITPLIKIATSDYGACSGCHAPWTRVVETTYIPKTSKERAGRPRLHTPEAVPPENKLHTGIGRDKKPSTTTIAWRPTCSCGGYLVRSVPHHRYRFSPWHWQHWQARLAAQWPAVQPCVVLDPFAGSGTTLATATALHRRSVGIELSPVYLEQIRVQVSTADAFTPKLSHNGTGIAPPRPADTAQLPLFHESVTSHEYQG